MSKPMLKKGYYVATLDNEEFGYYPVKTQLEENGDLSILKSPSAVSTLGGYIIVDSKTVYEVTIENFFLRKVSNDYKLSPEAISSSFVKFKRPLPPEVSSLSSSSGTGQDVVNNDDTRQADQLLQNHIHAIF